MLAQWVYVYKTIVTKNRTWENSSIIKNSRKFYRYHWQMTTSDDPKVHIRLEQEWKANETKDVVLSNANGFCLNA